MKFPRSKGIVAATLGVAIITLGACTGLPDVGFGTGGIRVLAGVGGAVSATVLPTGKIMTSAFKRNSNDNVVFRFNANGSVDTSYANRGVLTLGPGRVIIGSDGRTLLFSSDGRLATQVSAYAAAGSPDHSFAGGNLDLPLSYGDFGSAVSPAGDLYIWSCSSLYYVASCGLHHFNSAGQEDANFVDKLPSDNYGYVAGFGPDGSIFVVSYSEPYRVTPSHYVLTKLTPAGSPDTRFGNHGSIGLPAKLQVNSVAVDRSGKVTMLVNQGLLELVLRYTSLGQADRTFGWLGMAATPFGISSGPLAVDAQGRVTITSSSSGALSPVLVARLLANGQLDPKFGFAGQVTLSKVGGVSLLNMFVSGVTTDANNNPILGLTADYGMAQSPAPAIVRLTG